MFTTKKRPLCSRSIQTSFLLYWQRSGSWALWHFQKKTSTWFINDPWFKIHSQNTQINQTNRTSSSAQNSTCLFARGRGGKVSVWPPHRRWLINARNLSGANRRKPISLSPQNTPGPVGMQHHPPHSQCGLHAFHWEKRQQVAVQQFYALSFILLTVGVPMIEQVLGWGAVLN